MGEAQAGIIKIINRLLVHLLAVLYIITFQFCNFRHAKLTFSDI
jgi:hypothetical protein